MSDRSAKVVYMICGREVRTASTADIRNELPSIKRRAVGKQKIAKIPFDIIREVLEILQKFSHVFKDQRKRI